MSSSMTFFMNKKVFLEEYKILLNILLVNIALKIMFDHYFIVYNSGVDSQTFFDQVLLRIYIFSFEDQFT